MNKKFTDLIIMELKNRGYQAELTEVTKNGVVKKGIIIGDGNIRPTFYLNDFSTSQPILEIVDTLIDRFENNTNPDVDTKKLFSKEFITENVVICLQRTSNENIAKRPTKYDGIEMYLRVLINNEMSYKMKPDMFTTLNVNEDDVWAAATKNTFADVKIRHMSDVLSEMTGIPKELLRSIPMYYLSNTSTKYGASGILCDEVLRAFATEHNTDSIYIIPSSIHECLLVTNTDMPVEELTDMVMEVNGAEVAPEEQLSDKAYTFTI